MHGEQKGQMDYFYTNIWLMQLDLDFKDATKGKKWPQGSSSSTGEADEILERLLSIQNRIENGFTKIYDEIETLKTELNHNIKSVKEELGETTKSLNAVWEEVRLLKEENKELKKQLDSTTKKSDTLEKKVETLRSDW